MWRRILLFVGATSIAVTCNIATAQNAVREKSAPSKEAPPPELQDSIALSAWRIQEACSISV
jgi:hypothetical protein